MKITIRKNNGDSNSKIVAIATVEIAPGIKVSGFKIFKSKYDNKLIVYLPSRKVGSSKFLDLVKLSNEKECIIKKEIIEKYRELLLKENSKKATRIIPRIISVRLNILFHYYRHHKNENEMTAIRILFIAKNVVDEKRRGCVDINQLCKATGIQRPYLKKICRRSNLFRGVTSSDIYYSSTKKITRKHRLYFSKGKIRGEKLTKKFIKQFRNKKNFEGYICKCYMENDLDKKYRYKNKLTKGRIGYEMMAEYFKISRRTAISNIKISGAKKIKNVVDYRYKNELIFKSYSKFNNWLLRNMETYIGGHVVGNNPKSYFLKKIGKNRYCLAQNLPLIFKFTGVFLANAGIKRGK